MKKITSLILSSIVLWTTQSTIAADGPVVIGGVEYAASRDKRSF